MHFSAPSISKKRRFQLGAYQRTKSAVLQAELLKKAENDRKVQEIKVEAVKQETELQELAKKLHSRRELISKRKRKVKFNIFKLCIPRSFVL
jgi:hypothetical protein